MSQETKNDSCDKNQNEPCRAKHRRPDKQLYVPRAKREARHNVDVTLKPEIMNPPEQGSSNDRKTSGSSSPASTSSLKEKKKTSDKSSATESKKCFDATNGEKVKNGGKIKANQKVKKKTDVDKQKLQSTSVSDKSGQKIPSVEESSCKPQLVVSSSKIDELPPSSNVSSSVSEEKDVAENTSVNKNSQTIFNEESQESAFNSSEASVDVSQPTSEPTEDAFETLVDRAASEEFYPCQDYFTPIEQSDTENVFETIASTVTGVLEEKSDILIVNHDVVREIVAAKDASVHGTSDNKAVKKNSGDGSDFTWETMYNDDGECLHPELVKELTDAVGKVKIEKAKLDYNAFQPKEPIIGDSEFNHVIEIYDFPAEFRTTDLMAAFSQFKNRGFDIKWVDDTHALGLFASPIAAADALTICHPFIKTRPLSRASRESKLKARKCAEFLQPYRPRPETSASLARRLVGGALGLQVHVSKEQREKERQKLREAKEKKKHAAKQKNEIWEGVIPNSLAKVS